MKIYNIKQLVNFSCVYKGEKLINFYGHVYRGEIGGEQWVKDDKEDLESDKSVW